jgi:hypothetical protein
LDRSVNLHTVATYSFDGDEVAVLRLPRGCTMTDPTTKSKPCDQVAHHPFNVRPDISLLDALEHAAVYLNCAETLAHQAPSVARPEHSSSMRWASQQMLANARALMLAAIARVHAAQARGDV